MAKEPTWRDLKVASSYVKHWQDLGVGPKEFSILRKSSWEFIAKGRKEESDRVWKLIGAGYTLKRVLALAEEDSGLLRYLLALTKLNKEITPERLSRYEDIGWKLDVLLASEVVEWVELGLDSDQLDSLIRLDVIDRCDERGLEKVQEVFSKLRLETTAKSVDEFLDLIEDVTARLGTARSRSLVESGDFASVASDIQVADYEAAETDLYESGHYGDWAGIGLSQYGMDFYTTYFGENSTDADVLVDELRFLFGLGFSHDEMYSKVQRGFKYSQIEAMRAAGLTITQRTIDEWDGASDSKVILFFIDHGFTTDDRGDIFLLWNLGIDLIEPWWEFCKKQNWTTEYLRAQLISGVDFEDIATVPQITTLEGELAAELLDLNSYLRWREYGGMHNKFMEIQRWRKCGFKIQGFRYGTASLGDGDTSMHDPLGWKKLKFSPSDAVLWISALKEWAFDITPKSALAWKQAGVSAASAPDWIRFGVKSPAEAAAWIRSGADPETAATRKKAGVSPPYTTPIT